MTVPIVMPSYLCPTCGRQKRVPRPEDAPDRPFCSTRCRLIDLGKWFNEDYRISEPLDIPPDADAPPESPPGTDQD